MISDQENVTQNVSPQNNNPGTSSKTEEQEKQEDKTKTEGRELVGPKIVPKKQSTDKGGKTNRSEKHVKTVVSLLKIVSRNDENLETDEVKSLEKDFFRFSKKTSV